MKVVVTGSGGQLGSDLIACAPRDITLSGLPRASLDIVDAAAVDDTIERVRPDVVINTAAFTAVDLAESQQTLAFDINEKGVANIAASCARVGCRLIHISTDYVFDGASNIPYRPDDPVEPISCYGRSKRAGEASILEQEGLSYTIVRVSWLYGAHGHNFLKTMLRLMRQKTELNVVVDQIGTPTWTHPLATMLWRLVQRDALHGVWHWADLGVASWFDFARAIHDAGRIYGVLGHDVEIRPIPSADFPTPAVRPAYSVLDSSGLRSALDLPSGYWRDHVFELIERGIHE